MLSKRRTPVIAIILLLLSMTSAAQAESMYPQDGLKLNVVDTGKNSEEQNQAGLPSSVNITRFLDLEEIFNQEVSFVDIPQEKVWDDSTRLVADYYFGSGEIVPLVGISMGYIQKEDEEDQIVARPKIGLKYFMNPNAYLYGLLEYQLRFQHDEDLYDVYNQGQFVYGIGLGLSFSY